jgi:membrane protease YdiL (CAAX protease family)
MDVIPEAAIPVKPPVLGAKRALYSLISFFVPQVVAGAAVAVGGAIHSGGGRGASASHHSSPAVTLMCALFVGMLLGGLIVFRDARKCLPGSINSGALLSLGWVGARARDLWLAAGAGAILIVLYLGAMAAFPPSADQKFGAMSELLRSGGSALHIWAFGAVLVAPPCEEFVFRGLLFSGFRHSWGVWVASALVTAIFASLHLPETLHYTPALVVLFVFSIATLAARIATKSLLPCIVLHGTYNLGLVAVTYASMAISH